MVDAAFRRGEYSTCVFYHEQKSIRVVVRGGDFTIPGASKSLAWFREVSQQHMEVNFKSRLERNTLGSVRILNRVVILTDQGLEHEADQRHAQIFMKDMSIDESSKGVATPEVVSTSKDGAKLRRRSSATWRRKCT